MIFHENRLLSDIIPYFFRKLGKMSQNLWSAAVVISALSVKYSYKLVQLVINEMKKKKNRGAIIICQIQ